MFTRLTESRAQPGDPSQSQGLLAKNGSTRQQGRRASLVRKESVYEMEEGGPMSPPPYSDGSSGMEREKMGALPESKRVSNAITSRVSDVTDYS